MHRFIPPSDAASVSAAERAAALNVDHVAAIKRWTHELLRLPADTVIIVSEIACADAGCPLVETVVAVFEDTRTRSWGFIRPRVAVTKMMLQQTLASPPIDPTVSPRQPG